MPKPKIPTVNSAIAAPAFTTIDDVIQLAKELVTRLNTLGEYKHPLSVRKGVNVVDQQPDSSKTVKAKTKTYFFDLKQSKEGTPYLMITESRMKGSDGKPERTRIIVFPEDVSEFKNALIEMLERLNDTA